MAKLTTIGLYQYNSHLFDGLTFPAGIDKDIAVDQILTRSGEFEVLYPDPDFYSQMITFWGKKHYRTFEKWIEGLSEPFNPLYNYDRYEEYVDQRLGGSEKTRNASQIVGNTSDAETGTSGSRQMVNGEVVENTGETENKVSAFDSATYSPKDKAETSSGQTTNAAQSEGSQVDSKSTGKSDTVTTDAALEGTKENETSTHKAHLYGNIGVTTSAQMLREFLDIERFNIYEQIADLFIDEFCIMVY